MVDGLTWNDSDCRMIRPGFLSRTDRLELEACVRSQREDHGVARRANAILLLDDGKSCQDIAEYLYLDDDTVRGWYKRHREGGWDALAVDGWKGGQSRMTCDQEAALCAWLEGRFCRSTVEIRAYISTEFGLRYSHPGCIKLLACTAGVRVSQTESPATGCICRQTGRLHCDVRAPDDRA